MRITGENRAENYIKKHRNRKRWIAFALCLSLFTGTLTLYMLNKPATAMTEDGAKQVGLVLETADNEFEAGIIAQMNEAEADADEEASAESGSLDADTDNTESDAVDSADAVEIKDLEISDLATVNEAVEGISKSWEEIIEEIPEDDSALVNTGKELSADSGKTAEKAEKSSESDESQAKESEEVSDVILTARFVDGEGNDIAEAETIDFTSAETIDLSEIGINIDGFFYINATIDGKTVTGLERKTEVVKSVKTEEASDDTEEQDAEAAESEEKETEKVETSEETAAKEATDSDEADEAKASETDSVEIKDEEIPRTDAPGEGITESDSEETATYTYYVATTADGEELELKENTDIVFNYLAVNEKEEFVYKDDEVTVNVKLSNPKALPKGVELSVTTLDKDTEGYNYEAYLDALNESAEEIAKENGFDVVPEFKENNTFMFDICFKLDGKEYQIEGCKAKVSMSFNNKQVSDGLGTTDSSEIAMVHLPVSSDVMEQVDSTSEATDITSSDIEIDVLKDSSVEIESDKESVSFELTSFSVVTLYSVDANHTWAGNSKFSAKEVVQMLGDMTYFGAVASNYYQKNDIEANVAIGTLQELSFPQRFGNSENVLTYLSDYQMQVTKTVSGSPKKGTFYFALFKDKEATQKISGSDFTINTDENGVGTYTTDVSPFTRNSGKTSSVYVFELEGKGGKPLQDGATLSINGSAGYYTVNYDAEPLVGGNEILGIFSSSYIENNPKGYTKQQLLRQINGNKVYVKLSDNQYWEAVYHTDHDIPETVIDGKFPIDISEWMRQAEDASKKLAMADTSDDVLVINLRPEYQDLATDLTKLYYNKPDGYASDHGTTVDKDTLVLINLDLTGYKEYRISKFSLEVRDPNTGKTQTYHTGDWNIIANQIVVNVVQKDNKGNYVPYTGKLVADTTSGALIAPDTKQVETVGSYCGTVIADTIYQYCEIHKITVRRFLTVQGTANVYNVSSNAEKIPITVDKYIDGKLATDADSGKFSFRLGMYDPTGKYWKEIEPAIYNTGSKIVYELDPDKLGMSYGSSAEEASKHTYYFMLTENNTDSSKYNIDDTAVMIKIKYYKGGEKDPLYYRLSNSEYWDDALNAKTSYFDDKHRIKSSNNTSDAKLKNVAFYNTTAETVDIDVTKAWVLNGKDSSDIPSDTGAVKLTLYKVTSSGLVEVNVQPEVTTRNVSTEVQNADTAWKFTWNKLPKYDSDGNLVKYVVAETTVPDGFKTDAPLSSPKSIVFASNGGYKNRKTGSTEYGTATVTNKGVTLKLTLHKYLDNQTPTEKFDFVVKRSEWDGKKWKWVAYDTAPISNTGSDMFYTINPNTWRMKLGETYYFRITESEYKYDTNRGNRENSPYYANYNRDQGAVLVKVVYNGPNDVDINYYRLEADARKAIQNDASSCPNYCIPDYEVSGDKVAFYNSTGDKISISVTKVWDELVGMAKNNKAVADNIWDVTFRLMRSTDGYNWELAEEYTILTPNIWQDDDGGPFFGEMNDYPEDWTYDSLEGGYISKTITFNNLSRDYQYKIQEFYVDQNGNYNELRVGGEVVNGFKLESIGTTVDEAGNINYTLHNTPYIQIYKYWKFNGEDIDASNYNPVYVKLYRNYRADKSYVQMDYDQLVNSTDNKACVHQTKDNGAVIELNAANGWYAEFALDRKQDNGPNDDHVFQYVYLIRECDEYGNDQAESPLITYGFININNVTRTPSDVNYGRGFIDKSESGLTVWDKSYVSGNNYPVCILNVTNHLGINVLPSSGGIGTKLFTRLGAFMMIAAILGSGLYFLSNRNKKLKTKDLKHNALNIKKLDKIQRRGKMKVLRRLATIIAAFLVVFAMGAVSAHAAEGTIRITPPEGIDSNATNTYKVYKVFDAVGDGEGASGSMSYRLVSGKTTAPAGFKVDAAGNVSYDGKGNGTDLTADDIAAIKAYVTEADLVDTVTSKGTAVAETKPLPNGYYYITTSTGTAVTIDSTNPSAVVADKNTISIVDKKITGADEMSEDGKKALAQVGSEVTYTATVTVGNGSKNLVFHDKMQAGLTFAGNDSVKVTVGKEDLDASLYEILATPATGDTITIKFADNIAMGTEIAITYVAVVNKDALTKLENDAYLTYGDDYTSEHSTAEVYNAAIRVVKMNGNNTETETDDKPLAGAGFVLKNSEGKYYKLTTAEDGSLSASWVEKVEDADEHVSTEDGNVPAFIGLSDGVYTLVEKTVPAGFNKAKDVAVKISGGSYTAEDLEKLAHTEKVLNNQGSLLPSTGGIGTTIFYIIGVALVAAGVAYFMLRRKADVE